MELMDKEGLRELLALLDEANVNYKLCVGEGGKSLPLGGDLEEAFPLISNFLRSLFSFFCQ